MKDETKVGMADCVYTGVCNGETISKVAPTGNSPPFWEFAQKMEIFAKTSLLLLIDLDVPGMPVRLIIDLCPEGRAAFRAKKTSSPQQCLMNVPTECADGFSCQSKVKGVTQGYCCSEKSVCKDNAKFLLDDGTKMPKVCTPGLYQSCPMGYRCQLRTPQSTSGFCCKVSAKIATEGCPPGQYALVRKEKIVECSPFNGDASCPATFSCQYAVEFQKYQCCGHQPLEEEEQDEQGQFLFLTRVLPFLLIRIYHTFLENGCPTSQVAFLEGDRPQVCSSATNNCPFGYFCQFSDKNKQFQCCGHKAGCPGTSVAFLDLTGSPLACSKGKTLCPSGYSCQMAVNKSSTLISTTTTTTPAPPAAHQERSESSSKPICSSNEVLSKGVCSSPHDSPQGCPMYNFLPEAVRVYLTGAMLSGGHLSKAKIGGLCAKDTDCSGGSKCREGRCFCESGTVHYQDRCLANLCGHQQEPAVSADQIAVECIRGTMCPEGSSCTYSSTVSTYVCCRAARITSLTQAASFGSYSRTPPPKPLTGRTTKKHCPDGKKPMVFPSTQQPLLCDLVRNCPSGYLCIARMCCPSTNKWQLL
ncbi:EB module [Oesophagostomum dentatum]|uniref:EB module n=1 Tax=Oesophagostomum dentatum TaxID=61180 RepID=A0A0B1T4F7_OESDE|nr:EB module [Oesophagostomum dentatum]